MDKHLSIPIKYELVQYDDRFTKVRIYCMHDNLNLNGSNFKMSAIENAKGSIVNIPILGFIKCLDGTNESDFGGHEMELVITSDGEFKTKYLGRPIGVIPESNNNYHYETFDDKTYVVVEGYIWNDYANEALDILSKGGERPQSMEITVDDAYYDDVNGWYEITKYRYTGLCILGEDVLPAMVNAKVKLLEQNEQQFSKSYYEMVEQLCSILNNSKKEDEKMEFENEVVEKQEEIKEEVHEEIVKENEVINEEITTISEEPAIENPVEQEPSINYEVEYNSLKVVLENKDNEIFNLNSSLSTLKQEYEVLQNEVIELREYKSKVESEKSYAEKEQIFAKFSIGLTEEEMKSAREKINELSAKEINAELSDIFTVKNLSEISKKFSTDKKEEIPMDIPKKNDSKKKYAV